jgi:hypothetical protein
MSGREAFPALAESGDGADASCRLATTLVPLQLPQAPAPTKAQETTRAPTENDLSRDKSAPVSGE